MGKKTALTVQSILIVSFAPLFCAYQGQQPIINYITVSPTTNSSSVASAAPDPTTTLLAYQMFSKMIGQTQQAVATSSAHFGDFIQMHWHKLAGGLGVAAYATLFFLLFRQNRELEGFSGWGFWRNDLTDDQLMSASAASIEESLIVAIQERYFNPKEPVNFVAPLIRFSEEIDREITSLDRYIGCAHLLLKSPLRYFFPVSKEKKKHAKRAARRARFVKKLFLTWTAHHNVYASQPH